MLRGKKWEPVYEPLERIEKCLCCRKPECDNCLAHADGWAKKCKKGNVALREELRPQFTKLLKNGLSVSVAAQTIGIYHSLVKNWYSEEIELNQKRKQRKKEARIREEWKKIETMLDANDSLRKISRELKIDDRWYAKGRHAENYKKYCAELERSKGQHGNTDRKAEED